MLFFVIFVRVFGLLVVEHFGIGNYFFHNIFSTD